MSRFDENDAIEIFCKYKRAAKHFILKRKCEDAAKNIESAAFWATWYYFTYFDNELEQDIRDIISVVGRRNIFQPISGRLVFVCSYMHDNGELVRHYVRALKDNKIPTKMIVIDKKVAFGYTNTIKEIKEANNIELELIPAQMGYMDTAKRIADIIEEFRPEKILQHFTPYETKCLLGVSMISGIPKYNINYTDHTYWLGASLLDYNIEFRPYGCLVSQEKRHIAIEKLRMLPYYPIIEGSVQFEGFPFEKGQNVVFLSGGIPYKMIGDNDLFFKILDRILEESENAVSLIAAGNRLIKKKVNMMKNSKRVYIVPFRHDIHELMEHVDILYNTYPVGGGLMTMIAANANKPIVAFTKDNSLVADVDGLLNVRENDRVAFCTIDELCQYARHLCQNESYREKEGKRIHDMLQTREKFANQFQKVIFGNQSIDSYKKRKFNYEELKNNAIENANGAKTYISHLLRNDGWSAFYKYPQYLDLLFIYSLIRVVSYILGVIGLKKTIKKLIKYV